MALALVLTPATVVAGQTFTATATSSPAVPGEAITFQYDAQPNQTVVADPSGVAVATFTATTTGPVVATGPTSGTGVATATVTTEPTCLVTVAASPAAPTAGQQVTLTATVTCDGVPVQGALVELTAGGVSLGANLTTPLGTVTVTTSGLPIGVNTVTATVLSFPLASPCLCVGITGAVSVTVGPAAACSVTLASSPDNSTEGQPVTLTATVLCGGAPVVGATVLFNAGAAILGSATTTAAGQAIVTTSALPVGSNVVTATVIGEGSTCTCTGVAGTATVPVGPAQGFTARPACYTLNFPPLPWAFAHATLTVTGATPGATITFRSGGSGGPVLCTAVADTNGNASCLANLSVFQLLSGYTATTPVPGGFLTSSSTLHPCL